MDFILSACSYGTYYCVNIENILYGINTENPTSRGRFCSAQSQEVMIKLPQGNARSQIPGGNCRINIWPVKFDMERSTET